MGSAPLPGGVEGIRRALGDRVVTPPAEIVAELTRRFYNATDEAAAKDVQFRQLLAWLRACQTTHACTQPPLRPDTVPLPAPPEFWLRTLLDQQTPRDRLTLAIVGDRRAALFYTALLSMDGPTRAWFLERPDLVRRLSVIDHGALAVAAPYLRVDNGRWRLPGGPAAERVWTDLAAARLEDAPAFLTALLRAHGGLVTYALEVVATLDAPRQAALLDLGAADASRTLAAGRALIDALKPSVEFWRPGERPFWRPMIDPGLLIAQMTLDPQGRFALPPGRKIWQLVFGAGDAPPAPERARDAWDDRTPPPVAWLLARIGDAAPAERVVRSEQVLFASRRLAGQPDSAAIDVVTALWGCGRFPQLVRVLERNGVAEPARVAAMVRRAVELDAGGARTRDALAQWQGLVALIDHAARTAAMSRADVASAIDSLAATSGDAAGSRLRWLAQWLNVSPAPAGPTERRLEHALIARLTTVPASTIRRVSWEGEAYRLDVGAGERDRLTRVRGRDNRPLLDAAFQILELSARSAASASDDLAALAGLATAAGLDRSLSVDDERGRTARDLLSRARRSLTRDGGARASAASRAALGDLGETLATSALVELTYAVSMGWAEELPLTAAAASHRHVLVRDGAGRRGEIAWTAPLIVTDRRQPWHVAGSLLGLDVALAPVALRRVSKRPLTAAPLLNSADRTVLISTLAVLDRRDFTDEAQRSVVDAVTRARSQLAADPLAATGAAASAGVSPLRRTLAAWLAATDRPALASFFSLVELTRIGAGGAPLPDALSRWGNFDAPLSGRLSPGPLPALPVERYAGRSGRTLACAVPDLQLALALGLTELELPAALVPDLLPAALFDLVNTTASRHTDDWEAMTQRAQAVDRDAVERYLGLLTTQGPLRADAETPTH